MSAPHPARILVVDDEQAIRDLLGQLLGEEGYTVLTAADGEQALARAAADKPDLILLDIRMPKLDGMETCQRLRADPATKDIRVVMLTAYNTRDHLEESIKAGADDFLGKPINVAELRLRVRSMLKVKDIADEVERLQEYITAMRDLRGGTNATPPA